MPCDGVTLAKKTNTSCTTNNIKCVLSVLSLLPNQSINQSIRFIADKLHPYKSSKKPFRTGVHTINFSNAATRET